MNHKTNTIKWLAIITMTIDHIGAYLYPEFIWLRIIGRIAFPCFLYTTIYGVKRTKNFPMYLARLLGTGILSSYVTYNSYGVIWNILFALSIFAVTLYDWRFFIPGLFLSQFTEYGMYGLLLGWAIRITIDGNRWLGIVLLLILHYDRIGATQFFALLALIPILLPADFKLPRFPKWLGYSYYPIHLTILHIISRL